MADNKRLSKEELDALLGGEVITTMNSNSRADNASAPESKTIKPESGKSRVEHEAYDAPIESVDESSVVQRLLQAVHALHARVELLEGQVRDLRRQGVSSSVQPSEPFAAPPSKPAPRPAAPPAPRTEPTLSRVERYGRGRS